MVEETVELVNRHGLHLRPATRFVQEAQRFRSEVSVSVGDEAVNGKSILMLTSLAAERGAKLHLRADGDDAAEAVAALASLIRSGFDENPGA
jgi:phosphocarrier protein